MVTMSFSNVIKFPESTRGPLGNHDRAHLLKEARALVAQKLRETARALLAGLQEDLLAKGDAADERERRNFFYGGRDILRDSAVRIEGMVAAHWVRAFDESVAGEQRRVGLAAIADRDELQLLDFVDMDEEIAAKSLVGALQAACEEGLFAAGRRLAFLNGDEEGVFPLEEVMVDALHGALKEGALPVPLRLEILRGLEYRSMTTLAQVIHDLNAFLVGRRVLPKLRRSYARSRADKADAAAGASGDVFALLQRMAGVPEAAIVPTAPGGGTSGGAPGVVLSASMAAAMERAMASLDALQRISAPVAAPSTHVLRDFRTSSEGQNLNHLDAVTVDIVATLFDFIFDDPAVPDPIKALVARLQIPVLKVAMLDKGFFSSKSHPARRLLDGISRAAVRCGRDMDHQDPLYARIAGIIERLQAEFAQDTSLFDVLCGELDDFLAGQEAEADARAARAAPLVAQREQREMAAVAADQTLAGWLAMPLPAVVTDLLTHEWRALLVDHYLRGDEAAWNQAVAMITDLVFSVGPQSDGQGRKLLATKLPGLVKQIHDGLNQLHVPVERRAMLIDCLFSIHAAVLRGSAPVVTTPLPQTPTPASAEIVTESVEAEGAQLQNISLVDTDRVPLAEDDDSEAQLQVDDLQRGDWVEFAGDAGPVRYRLSWVSPERGILLFTNPQSPRALSVAPAALALQIERGEATIVPVEPIFERAVHRALETLKAA